MRHYATLFDSRFLPQGLALYDSLVKHSSEPLTLDVLPMDEECGRTLGAMCLPGLRVADRETFELYQNLDALKVSRTYQEYCWMCASQFCEYLIHLDEITYLDADLMFFSDPKAIFDEMAGASIAVIPHRLADNDQRERLEKNGKFNVSWVTFRGEVGRECLSRWAAQCRERCSAEVGCGDQCYLDEWPERYGDELKVIENIGAGLAPWNLARYDLEMDEDFGLLVGPRKNGDYFYTSVVFYHYHEYKHGERLTNYPLRLEDIRLIYEPYILAVTAAKERIDTTLSIRS